MERFDGLTEKQIQRGLIIFNGLQQFDAEVDLYYSKCREYVVLGPSSVTISLNLENGENPQVCPDWKLFHNSNLKCAVSSNNKIFIILQYSIKLVDGSVEYHAGLLYIDPKESISRYVDSLEEVFDQVNLEALEEGLPWNLLYGKRNINSYIYKYNSGISRSCVLECLNSIDRIIILEDFNKAAKETLYLRRVRRLKNKKINITSPYEGSSHICYLNRIRYCYDILLAQNVIQKFNFKE